MKTNSWYMKEAGSFSEFWPWEMLLVNCRSEEISHEVVQGGLLVREDKPEMEDKWD
jgi:hypothetical protein